MSGLRNLWNQNKHPMTVLVQGESTKVLVEYSYHPAEPDVGLEYAGYVMDAAWTDDNGCVMQHMTDFEIRRAEEQLNKDLGT